MRFFKKEGSLKFRKSADDRLIEDWLETGWKECDKSGTLIADKSKKKTKADKK